MRIGLHRRKDAAEPDRDTVRVGVHGGVRRGRLRDLYDLNQKDMEGRKQIDEKTRQQIVSFYISNKDNRVDVIAERFGVKPAVVHKALNKHFKKRFLILESSMNKPE